MYLLSSISKMWMQLVLYVAQFNLILTQTSESVIWVSVLRSWCSEQKRMDKNKSIVCEQRASSSKRNTTLCGGKEKARPSRSKAAG